ncbi:MAG: hypothetical protein C3F13_13215 [Anaerolineales bacterium]|nr:hypothetical protein [Anaerolineae bacterium]PWB51397.1 MAG: hypothetical protein C3F13_13215 [Anaerolineales bacterium]
MSDNKTKRQLVGIWQIFHIILWAGGLYYLFSRGPFFPGILVLIAISAIYEALLRRYIPTAYQEKAEEVPNSPSSQPTVAPIERPPAPTAVEHHLELLPQACPSCNGPVRGHEVKWTGPQSADCPYCGTNLPMAKV